MHSQVILDLQGASVGEFCMCLEAEQVASMLVHKLWNKKVEITPTAMKLYIHIHTQTHMKAPVHLGFSSK